MMRERISRPWSSVPSQCSALGGSSRASAQIADDRRIGRKQVGEGRDEQQREDDAEPDHRQPVGRKSAAS